MSDTLSQARQQAPNGSAPRSVYEGGNILKRVGKKEYVTEVQFPHDIGKLFKQAQSLRLMLDPVLDFKNPATGMHNFPGLNKNIFAKNSRYNKALSVLSEKTGEVFIERYRLLSLALTHARVDEKICHVACDKLRTAQNLLEQPPSRALWLSKKVYNAQKFSKDMLLEQLAPLKEVFARHAAIAKTDMASLEFQRQDSFLVVEAVGPAAVKSVNHYQSGLDAHAHALKDELKALGAAGTLNNPQALYDLLDQSLAFKTDLLADLMKCEIKMTSLPLAFVNACKGEGGRKDRDRMNIIAENAKNAYDALSVRSVFIEQALAEHQKIKDEFPFLAEGLYHDLV